MMMALMLVRFCRSIALAQISRTKIRGVTTRQAGRNIRVSSSVSATDLDVEHASLPLDVRERLQAEVKIALKVCQE
jgi:hypothetical protein